MKGKDLEYTKWISDVLEAQLNAGDAYCSYLE
jgi:hypothetical protein